MPFARELYKSKLTTEFPFILVSSRCDVRYSIREFSYIVCDVVVVEAAKARVLYNEAHQRSKPPKWKVEIEGDVESN